MPKEYFIHFENRRIILTNSIRNHFDNNFGFFYSYRSFEELSKVLDFFQSIKLIDNVFLSGKDADAMLADFSKFFKVLTAAGGVVINKNGQILLIHRKGKWDLPKGKPEGDESIEATALREVSEETGITNINLIKHLTDTYHTYQINGLTILKKTVWFEMSYMGDEPLKPQIIEDINEAKWVSRSELPNYFINTYNTIKEVFKSAGLN